MGEWIFSLAGRHDALSAVMARLNWFSL
jgi:hypothetical protein